MQSHYYQCWNANMNNYRRQADDHLTSLDPLRACVLWWWTYPQITHQANVNVKDLLIESAASGSKQAMPLIPEREMVQGPLIKDQFMCYQGPAGGQNLSHSIIAGLCTAWIDIRRELIQFGYLGFKTPAEVRCGWSGPDRWWLLLGMFQPTSCEEEMRDVRRKLFQRQVGCYECGVPGWEHAARGRWFEVISEVGTLFWRNWKGTGDGITFPGCMIVDKVQKVFLTEHSERYFNFWLEMLRSFGMTTIATEVLPRHPTMCLSASSSVWFHS